MLSSIVVFANTALAICLPDDHVSVNHPSAKSYSEIGVGCNSDIKLHICIIYSSHIQCGSAIEGATPLIRDFQ
jgi:hypothetical protein